VNSKRVVLRLSISRLPFTVYRFPARLYCWPTCYTLLIRITCRPIKCSTLEIAKMTRGTRRRRVAPVVLAATALLLVLDVVGALVRQPLGFPYPSMAVVPPLVYLAVGLAGAWRASFAIGVLAAIAVGLLDGTFGPLLAWLAGSGPVGQTITEPRIFAYGITVVTATAGAAGLIGAALGSWLERRRAFRGSGVVPQ
jgi:hypothetical protein